MFCFWDMKQQVQTYTNHHDPISIVARAIWLVFHFKLSLREVEEMMLERGVEVSYEMIRRWCRSHGFLLTARLHHKSPSSNYVWHLDEAVVSIDGKWYWLWHAVDQDEYVLNEIVQIRRNTKAAKRLLVRILKKQKCAPKRFVIDKLRLYGAPYVTLCPILIISHTKDWTIDPRIHTCRFANESERSKAFDQLDYCSISYQSFQPYETTIFQ